MRILQLAAHRFALCAPLGVLVEVQAGQCHRRHLQIGVGLLFGRDLQDLNGHADLLLHASNHGGAGVLFFRAENVAERLQRVGGLEGVESPAAELLRNDARFVAVDVCVCVRVLSNSMWMNSGRQDVMRWIPIKNNGVYANNIPQMFMDYFET